METQGRATRIALFDFSTPPMRAFHMTWTAFFVCFCGWFGIAPLLPVVREDLGLSQREIGNTVIASVAVTVLARVAMGWLCDRVGPRLAYSGLLVAGSLPVMGMGLARDYESFLLLRLAVGAVGASFVITQVHTAVMFAPSVVGTASATTAGWGNLGGGVTQMVMPLVFSGLVALGAEPWLGWRLAMVVPGAAMVLWGAAYFFLTQDSPRGNFSELRESSTAPSGASGRGRLLAAARDLRVWALFVLYGACFGVGLTIHNLAALYWRDQFGLSVTAAGFAAGLFGLTNLFARTLGGVLADRAGARFGLRGRAVLLGLTLLGEGLALVVFSRMTHLSGALATMVVFSLFVHMASGATFAVVPFLQRRSLGSVAGIVGAGGNAGAVAAGFLFRSDAASMPDALLGLGIAVTLAAPLSLLVRFAPESDRLERSALDDVLEARGEATTT